MSDVIEQARPQWKPAVATLLLVACGILGIAAAWLQLNSAVDPIRASDLVFVSSMLVYAGLGWLIIVKGPQNALGWVCLTFPLLLAIAALLEEFGLRAALAGFETPAALLVMGDLWLSFSGYLVLNGPVFVLFPDGRFPSMRFRWAFWVTAALVLVCATAYTISAEPVCVARLNQPTCTRTIPNPLALVHLDGLRQQAYAALAYLLLFGAVVSLVGVAARYRRATNEVRQQIKWVAWVSAVGVPLLLVVYGAEQLLGFRPFAQWNDLPWIAVVSVGGPVAIGIAIFKYRLYEIDRLISRTATYSLVAVLLAVVYAGGVTLTQRILPIQNQFGIVFSTLAVAALFNPLRRRVRLSVDRRFNRSRYDAQRVLEDFSGGLRDDTELEQMQSAVLLVALETLEPAHISLWVRPPFPKESHSL